MKRWLIVLIALVVLLVPPTAFAATFAEVTVTATPSFISISIAQNTWTINGIDGSGKIAKATTYYSNATGATGDVTAPQNPVVDGDCYFMVDNTSSVVTDLTTNMIDFTGGDAMTNINTGYTTNGANAYGASTYISGAAWPAGAVILKNAASAAMKVDLAANTDLYFGIAILTKSGDFTSGGTMTSTVTVTATDST